MPVRDAATMGPVPEARLALSVPYLATAPVGDVLDVLTLLSVAQHVALLISLVVVYALFRICFGRWREGRIGREVGYGVTFLVALVAVYAFGALAPRPMAELVVSAPDVLTADFHSHTRYSHDGRPGWTAEDVRAWHRGAGFDVAYISDHRTFEGAERARADNPLQAGEGTTLLQAIEVFFRGEHLNILGAGRRYRGLTTPDLRDTDEDALILASSLPSNEPILVQTIPGKLTKLSPALGPGTAGVRAIEVIDGSPRGLGQSRRERAAIVKLADSLNLALVAGSDNHGWGRTAPAWTLIRIPGWRGMTPDSLSVAIDGVLRGGGRGSTRVIERVVADPGGNTARLVLTLPIVLWRMLTTLSPDERVMWIVWCWALVLVESLLRARRTRRLAVP